MTGPHGQERMDKNAWTVGNILVESDLVVAGLGKGSCEPRWHQSLPAHYVFG